MKQYLHDVATTRSTGPWCTLYGFEPCLLLRCLCSKNLKNHKIRILYYSTVLE